MSVRTVLPLAAIALALLARSAAADERSSTALSHGNVTRWANVLWPTAARTAPRPDALVVTVVKSRTPEGEPNLVLALEERSDESSGAWVHVRLAILPLGSKGWLPRASLGPLRTVRTHLVVDRERLRATLYRNGAPLLATSIGVGKRRSPTPRGQFYVRERLAGFGDPFYGPIAFGTSARSATLTDWPGGGYIGIHGTDDPGILPGRVSHGCIRMRNDAILRLVHLMPLGTPLTIR